MDTELLLMTASSFTKEETLLIKKQIQKKLAKDSFISAANMPNKPTCSKRRSEPEYKKTINIGPLDIKKAKKSSLSSTDNEKNHGAPNRSAIFNGDGAVKSTHVPGEKSHGTTRIEDPVIKSKVLPIRVNRLLCAKERKMENGQIKNASCNLNSGCGNIFTKDQDNNVIPPEFCKDLHIPKLDVNAVVSHEDSTIINNNCDIPQECVALDCEFVGVGQGKISALGRCSVIDYDGNILLDIYAKPNKPVTDYRTRWSGIRPRDLHYALPFAVAKARIAECIKGKIVIGHAVQNDFSVLGIHPAKENVRDTSTFPPLLALAGRAGGRIGLKSVTKRLLGRNIQGREHCSVEDARACMDLYHLVEECWEEKIEKKKRENNMNFLQDDYWPDGIINETPQL